MKFTAGDTVTISVKGVTLVVKIEDASKGESISARIEEVPAGTTGYHPGQICEFSRDDIGSPS